MKNKFTNDALAFCENCISGNGLVVKIFGKNKPKQPEYVNCFWFRTICFITFQEKCCFSKDAGQPKALAEIITFLQVFFMFYNIIPIAKYSTAVLFCILGNFLSWDFQEKVFLKIVLAIILWNYMSRKRFRCWVMDQKSADQLHFLIFLSLVSL